MAPPIRWGSGHERPSYRGLQRLQRQWARGFGGPSPMQTTTGGTRRHIGWNKILGEGYPTHAELEAEVARMTSVGNLFSRGLLRIEVHEIGLGSLVTELKKWPTKNQSNVLKAAVAAGTKVIAKSKKATPSVTAIYRRVVKNRTGALEASLGTQYTAPRILSRGAAFQKFRSRVAAPAAVAAGGRIPDDDAPGGGTFETNYGQRRDKRKRGSDKYPERMMTKNARSYWKPNKAVKDAASKLWISRTLKGKMTKRQGSVGGDEQDTIKPYKYAHLVERGTRRGGWRTTPSRPKPFFRAIYYAKRNEMGHKMVDGLLGGLNKEIGRILKAAEDRARKERTPKK